MLMLDYFARQEFSSFCSHIFLLNFQFWLTLLLTPTVQHWQDKEDELLSTCTVDNKQGKLYNSLSLHRDLLYELLLNTNEVDKIDSLAVN